ncbi:MAG TPA: ATP-binding protein [Smithellaceae bacterium]|nr:ATP-binding protein [Smithellaceae bacterium]HRS83772.1 ATP-binding protein [Smithellaceae bacterium]HRV45287.1 ATP-binding protein [Smithellaceae bacterium]
MMYYTRTLEKYFLQAAHQFPVSLVTGARQVGKTTFLQHLTGNNRTYVTLDDPLVLNLAKNDPALFMQRFPAPLLIDEIQYAPELLPYIKMESDRNRKTGLFWLTGSQHFHLMKGVSESLAGRVGIVRLLGFSRREQSGEGETSTPFLPSSREIAKRLKSGVALTLKDIFNMIWRGSFPAIAVSKSSDRDLFYHSYVQTYLQRDVRDLARVGDEMAFLKFLRAAAARTGQMLNLADMARDVDVAYNTAKSWLSILQASGLVYLLEPYFTNVTKRLVKTPKLYFLDTGLCTWLTEWSSPETLEAGAFSGAILETWIFVEILKSWLHNGQTPPFYFYRDKDGKEIDLLIIRDNTIYPLEFKKTSSPDKRTVQHFTLLEKLNMKVGGGGVVCLAAQSLPITERVSSIPVSAI